MIRQGGSIARLMKMTILFFTAMSVTASAVAQECVPLEPKEFSGDFMLPGGGGFVSTNVFERGECNWNGLDALNGFDAWIFDVTGYGGQPATVTPGAAGEDLGVFFLNENCERSGFTSATTDLPATVPIPAEAKWIVAHPNGGATATSVTVEILGRDCETEEEPKKKKKKKKKKKGGNYQTVSAPPSKPIFTYL